MNALIFRSPSGVVLKLDRGVVEQMERHAQRGRGTPEAGGILLGRWLVDASHYIVDEISEPTSEDRGTRTSFFRSEQSHRRRIQASLQRSQRTCGYLGEWHTHPEPDPRPSATDLGDWRRRLVADRVDIPEVFFVIVGTESIRVWMAPRAEQGRRIVNLQPVTLGYFGPGS